MSLRRVSASEGDDMTAPDVLLAHWADSPESCPEQVARALCHHVSISPIVTLRANR